MLPTEADTARRQRIHESPEAKAGTEEDGKMAYDTVSMTSKRNTGRAHGEVNPAYTLVSCQNLIDLRIMKKRAGQMRRPAEFERGADQFMAVPFT
ncbi:MAG: hypothetical protein IJ083_04450 [Clostridia bacterium]|nr:hypothetical protein [Clostridia bacterium]